MGKDTHNLGHRICPLIHAQGAYYAEQRHRTANGRYRIRHVAEAGVYAGAHSILYTPLSK